MRSIDGVGARVREDAVCILVVEDEPLIRMIVVEELTDAGFTVCEASDGDMAAAFIKSRRGPIFLLITDIHMPGSRTGLDVADMMQERFPFTPIIFTTGRPDVVEAFRHFRPEDKLLSKPFVPSTLMQLVHQILSPDPGNVMSQ